MFGTLRRQLAAALILTLLAGCISQDQWTFGVSRSFHQRGGMDSLAASLQNSNSTSNGAVMAHAAGAVALVALPAAVDVVLLPVTVPVDLWNYVLRDMFQGGPEPVPIELPDESVQPGY